MIGVGPLELLIIIAIVIVPFIGKFFDETLWKNQNPNMKMSLPQTLFSFKGRINRAKWWLARLLVFVLVFVATSLISLIAANLYVTEFFIVLFLIGLPVYILSVGTHLPINVKRWHDRDKSGWWVLIELIPLIGIIWAFIELGCLKGTYGKNRFGPDPLEHA